MFSILRKRTAASICFLVAALVCLLAGYFPSVLLAEPLGTAAPDHITLTWEGDPRTTETISWRTDADTVAGQVEFVPSTAAGFHSAAVRRIEAGVESFSTNMGDMKLHSVTLTGLKPAASYLYRVGSGEIWSEPHSFTTAAVAVSRFKFLIFGDSQSGDYGIWQTTIHQAYQANQDAAFFINMGDLVDVGQDYSQWNGWFDAAQGVIDTIPAMPLTGNHEMYTPEHQFSLPLYFTTQFKLPLNGPAEMKRQVYSFDYGNVHFVMLDSQAGEEREFLPTMLDSQKAWLEQDLAATDKPWKLVFLHRPPYSNKETEDNAGIREAFVPVLDQYHADIVFSGHDHVYARTYPLRGGEVVDSTAQGTIYAATGRSGTKTYKKRFAQDWNEFFYNPLEEPNYLTVEVQGDTLNVQAFSQSGELIDSWTVRHGQ
ncbi:MAG: metallophosphoesterase family protein [Veillonellales bacterium]